MKIIEITPAPLKKSNWSTRAFLSDEGIAYTTWDNGRPPIKWEGLFLYPKREGYGGAGYKSIKVARKEVMLHRAVALAFIPNPEHKPVVNHKDGNKENNRADNLEWVTYAENSQHAYDIGLLERRGRTRLWCTACNKSALSTWCVENFDDKQVRWKVHRAVVRQKVK